ncbi:MAG: ribbon-helix-helix protein, CopG family [Limnochordia bacterium]|nr:ribbon-helix-helix protein, CopG family [Limnochordia bacterium]MDI9465770.1 ribbon-helix-helix protein, CopG family [Bacillota bacterium]HPP71960.1 ribbon-helix-helix protein, CopG family [Limnochordia bacterium]
MNSCLDEVTSPVDTKRVQIRIPAALLAKIDSLAHEEKINRSQFIQNVVQLYIMEKEAQSLQDKLRVGYQIMAELNLTLAEEGNDAELLESYERQLAEAE